MDYRNSLKTTLYTTTGISLGAIITLIAAVFTQAIITFWVYLIIPIILVILVILYLFFIQTKLNDRIEKTDNYSNYIQVLLRKSTTQATPDKINQFIPFSFTFKFIKTKDQSLNECLREFKQANPSDYLEYKEIPRKRSSIPWFVIIQSTVIVIIITIFVVFQIYYSYSRPTLGLIGQLIIAIIIIISIGAYFLGKLRSIKDQLNKRRLKQFFGKSANNPDRIKLIIPVLQPREAKYHPKEPFDNEMRPWVGPENVLALEDIQAAGNLISLLEPLTSQAIEPITDEDSLGNEDMCLICIGSPLSNRKASLLMEDVEQSVVSWVKTPKDQYHQKLRVKSGKVIKEFISTQTEDYGLILKIESKSSKREFAFLIAGITEFGTIGAARYLKKKWKKLNNKADRKPFICVIHVDKKNMERIKEVYFKTIVK